MDYISEFDIHLKKEMYYPGELLSGFVFLNTIENFKLKAIKAHLRGEAHCEWKIMIKGEKRTIKDEEVFIDDHLIVFGNENNEGIVPVLPRGQHIFKFKFDSLPESDLPCSLETRFCTIRYFVKVTLDIPYASAPQGIKYFTIIGPHIDCMDQKYLKPLHANEHQKLCCFCCSKYTMQLKCQLERSAYCAGEAIRLKATVHNNSNQIVRLKIKLIQYFECNINRGVIGVNKQDNHVVLEYRGEEILPESKYKFDSAHSLVIPVMPPTLNSVCCLVNISYLLKVCIESDKCCEVLKITFPVLIATNPFRIPNSGRKPRIEYEPSCDHVEGGMYISPEFQLGQVYDGSCNTTEDVVLYRPVYVCVKHRSKLNQDFTNNLKNLSLNDLDKKDC